MPDKVFNEFELIGLNNFDFFFLKLFPKTGLGTMPLQKIKGQKSFMALLIFLI